MAIVPGEPLTPAITLSAASSIIQPARAHLLTRSDLACVASRLQRIPASLHASDLPKRPCGVAEGPGNGSTPDRGSGNDRPGILLRRAVLSRRHR
jgi:hypothetical protein